MTRALLSAASATVGPDGRLAEVHSEPPLTLRKIFSENKDICALCLVGSAAGPLPGDDLRLELTVRDGAQASLIAAGAMIAQGRDGAAALTTTATVGADASLDADPGALIVCHRSHVDVTVQLALQPTSTLRWREVLVLGRANEAPGSARLRWNVTVGGAPLLRQALDLTDATFTTWPGMIGKHRTIVTELVYDPHVVAQTIVHSRTDVIQQLGDHASLRTTLT